LSLVSSVSKTIHSWSSIVTVACFVCMVFSVELMKLTFLHNLTCLVSSFFIFLKIFFVGV
jgi:hypothetical protein